MPASDDLPTAAELPQIKAAVRRYRLLWMAAALFWAVAAVAMLLLPPTIQPAETLRLLGLTHQVTAVVLEVRPAAGQTHEAVVEWVEGDRIIRDEGQTDWSLEPGEAIYVDVIGDDASFHRRSTADWLLGPMALLTPTFFAGIAVSNVSCSKRWKRLTRRVFEQYPEQLKVTKVFQRPSSGKCQVRYEVVHGSSYRPGTQILNLRSLEQDCCPAVGDELQVWASGSAVDGGPLLVRRARDGRWWTGSEHLRPSVSY
jgi:hypothetical protein